MPDASRHIGNYELDPTSSSGGKKPYRQTADGTAIIPVIGSLVGRGGWIGAMSGIQSYENIKFALGAAVNDKTIKNIVLDIDSPGGEAVGAFEAADAVRAGTAKKEVIAVATGLCCSAAYAIASAASQIITTKSSVIGSIGVVLLHADYSRALHERGVVPTLIHAGKRKTDGTPYKPLTDEVKASLKAEVEEFNSLFVATVAEGRPSLTPSAILAMEAGTYIGAGAVAIGLADRVGSLEGVLARLGSGAGAPTPAHFRTSSLQLAAPAVPPAPQIAASPAAALSTKPAMPPPAAPAAAGWDSVIAEINGSGRASVPEAAFGNDAERTATLQPNPSARSSAVIGFGWDSVVAEVNGKASLLQVFGNDVEQTAASQPSARSSAPIGFGWDVVVAELNRGIVR